MGSCKALTVLFELPKLDRGLDTPLNQWLHFFNHGDEADETMSYSHAPVQRALNELRSISADDRERQLADMREKALHDETTLLQLARKEGREAGRKEGQMLGLEKGREQGLEAAARNLFGLLSDEQIAAATGLELAKIKQLRADAT